MEMIEIDTDTKNNPTEPKISIGIWIQIDKEKKMNRELIKQNLKHIEMRRHFKERGGEDLKLLLKIIGETWDHIPRHTQKELIDEGYMCLV